MRQRFQQAMENIYHCTRGVEGEICVIISKLPILNLLLWNTQLQLQETTPGWVTLKTFLPGHLHENIHGISICLGQRLLELLLRHHRCIVSIDIDGMNLQEPNTPLLQILIRNVPSLVSLRISNTLRTVEELASLTSALVTAFNLEELGMQTEVPLNGLCALQLHTFFSRTDTLTTVSICHVEHKHASLLLKGLERNTTVHTLTLSTCTCFQGTPHGSPLVAVLTHMQALRTLNLSRCCFQCRTGLNAIMQALVDNRRLLALSLHGFACCEAFRELMPLLLTRNSVLRKLHVECAPEHHVLRCPCKSEMQNCADCRSLVNYRESVAPLSAVISRNEWLEELTVDLSETSVSECHSFFQNLQFNSVLRSVIVLDMLHVDAMEICRAIRRYNVGGIVSIKCAFVISNSVEALVACTQMPSVIIDVEQLVDEQLLYSAIRQLPRLHHVTRLTLVFSPEQLASVLHLLLAYVQTTTKLRELELDVEGPVAEPIIRRTLMETLLSNKSLRNLCIEGGMLIRPPEAQDVAHVLCANDTLCQLALFDRQDDDGDLLPFEALLLCLFPHLGANFTLCELEHDPVPCSANLTSLQAVLHRNRAYAMRAAHYAVGADRSDYCGCAMRFAWDRPQVLLNVMEMTSVGEDEAAAMIQRTFFQQRLEQRYPLLARSLDAGPNRNGEADTEAHALTSRGSPSTHSSEPQRPDAEDEEYSITTYGDVLQWYRTSRRLYPPPHRDLQRSEAATLRQLQVQAIWTPVWAKHVCPEVHTTDICQHCKKARATQRHLLWDCAPPPGNREAMPTAISSKIISREPGNQRDVVQHVLSILERQRPKAAPPRV
ncbi:hypothetical protein HPB49_021795 [Dermacentor silvarum]|uniref:Uncharacterized protein n=1 Tax=Dermacentor silvarum TaxID=543639 RepID=A0ACB8CHK7_DERSI|nr:hypothetical protein HPB49_021795 [Dermacentor silvarum]